jgi:SAM-dependent methyltransferase
MTQRAGYALGYSDLEHDRLTRQAERFRDLTEGLFRTAGLREGWRVLDLGSGVGDVAMLTASIVGSSGSVVGVERDARSVRRARDRAAEAGLANLTFLEGDVAAIPDAEPFDAVVGRFILQFVPDPVATLRSVARVLRPHGIVAIQEVAWTPARAANSHLPLWSACASVVHEAIRRAGARTDPGLTLHRVFQEATLPPPTMTFDMKIGASRELILWVYDLLCSVRPGLEPDHSIDELGDLDTLADRLVAEVAAAKSAVTSVAVIGAWSQVAAGR